MAGKFTETKIKSLIKNAEVGKHAVGNGLYFRISKEGSGFWVCRYSIYKSRREMTIGQYPMMGLAKANAEAANIKLKVMDGIDPLADRERGDPERLETVNDLAEDGCRSEPKD